MMDDRPLLGSRILSLLADLGKAEAVVEAMPDKDLRRRLEVRFASLFAQRRQEVRATLTLVKSGHPLEACWQRFAEVNDAVAPLTQECLALVHGSLARHAELDGGICQLADRLLYRLSWLADVPWTRFTVISDGEYLDPMVGVIGVRFPEATIWDLPLVAHELGHYVGPEIKVTDDRGDSRRPFELLLKDIAAEDFRFGGYIHEHLADIFATYTVGPAFALACVVSRFDPLTAFDPEGDIARHPAAGKRVHVILRTLRAMDHSASTPFFDVFTNRLEELWYRTVAATGTEPKLDDATVERLNKWQDELYQIVDFNPTMLRYRGWELAKMLAEEIKPDGDPAPRPSDETTIFDVLNAAWFARMACPDPDVAMLRRIADKAIAVFNAIPDDK